MHKIPGWVCLLVCLCAPLALASPASGPGRGATIPLLCGEVGAGQTAWQRSGLMTHPDGRFRAALQVTVVRPEDDALGQACSVTYELLAARGPQPLQVIHRRTLNDSRPSAAAFLGLSPDGTRLAVDFWSGAGSSVVHRPVVYDLRRRRFRAHDLGDAIARLVPGCRAAPELAGVTDAGTIRVQLRAQEQGAQCSEREWLFDPSTGAAYKTRPAGR